MTLKQKSLEEAPKAPVDEALTTSLVADRQDALEITRKTRRWLLPLLVFLIIGFVGLNVLAYTHAYSMMHFTSGGTRTHKPEALSFLTKSKLIFTGVNIPRPVSALSPSALAADCVAMTIGAPEDITLAAWYCDRGEGTPLVVLFHGYAAEKTELLPEAKAFLDLGASVLLVDFRGSGGSSESYTTVGVREADDVAAVFRHASDELSHSSIILFGQSMGAVSILRAVREHGIEPDAVILEAVFDTMLNTVRNRFEAMGVPSFPAAQALVFWGGVQGGFNGFAHKPVDYAQSLTCPALFMHGADDPRATLAEALRVYAVAPGPKTFTEFEAVGHEEYVSKYPEQWRTAVEKIIGSALKAPRPPKVLEPIESSANNHQRLAN